MEELKECYDQWSNFVATRESERARLIEAGGGDDLKQRIRDKKAEVLRVKAELQMLEAQFVLAGGGQKGYNKSAFDAEWQAKKGELKHKVESLMAEQMEKGVTIPKIMKTIGCKSPSWLYSVRESLHLYRDIAQEDTVGTRWEWSDATAVHRYALGTEVGSSDWAFVLMKGVTDSEFEGEQCVFAFDTGYFISGNRMLFDSVPPQVKAGRATMLAQILGGTYTKSLRRDNNTYFDVN